MTNENKIKDGGPAFPTEARALFPTNKASFWCDGMSLRDWFAGMALQGMNTQELMFAEATRYAYQIADAMLKEREKNRESILDQMIKENQEMGLYEENKED